ncbi:mismatch-specific DNA-glycosylase [Williamsia sterculiae]|uniref:G/U mismatch-specific uracil-DNA glycosylase n=1 Tax=Williamsia sterculiae TaxID=1344003 RepID=A0A1N7H3A8_9NOCA|nr:mismatch-specific DNA-glycosylase [Williamsia sterculiae]SIS19306.1 G/U mismatch-specific uracil-DNA glycosylase [Williamsia sterculiae]
MALTRAELQAHVGGLVDDLLGDDCRLLFVGINPGLVSAAVNAHFARRGNRFYPALQAAGLTDRVIDASTGMSDRDRDALTRRGIGITNIVGRASAKATDLDSDELRRGADELAAKVEHVTPAVVAILGVGAYRIAFDRPGAVVGRQEARLGGAELWVAPNPSGLNAHETVTSLGRAYHEIAVAAGVVDR